MESDVPTGGGTKHRHYRMKKRNSCCVGLKVFELPNGIESFFLNVFIIYTTRSAKCVLLPLQDTS